MLSVHETGIKMQLAYFRKTLKQWIRYLRYQVEPVFSGYPRRITGLPLETGWPLNTGPQNRRIMEQKKKAPCFAIIDHIVYKNSPKNTTNIDSGR